MDDLEKIDLMVACLVLDKKMFLEQRGNYTYFIVSDSGEPWKFYKDSNSHKSRYTQVNSYTEYDSHTHILTGLKKHSSDYSAMQEVLNYTTKNCFSWHLESDEGNDGKIKWSAVLWRNIPFGDGEKEHYSSINHSLPLAVCKASLSRVLKEATKK